MAASVQHWPSLLRLRCAALAHLNDHFRLVILSNVDNASFAFSNMRRLGVDFDAIHTAEWDNGSPVNRQTGILDYCWMVSHAQGVARIDIP